MCNQFLPAKTSEIALEGRSDEPLKTIDLGELRMVKSLQLTENKVIKSSHDNQKKSIIFDYIRKVSFSGL